MSERTAGRVSASERTAVGFGGAAPGGCRERAERAHGRPGERQRAGRRSGSGAQPGDVVSEEPVPVTQALDGLLRSLRGGAGRAEIGGVFGRWEEAVGPAIAANVRPVRLEHGTLLVEVDEPAWATQVRLLSDDVRRRLAEVTGVEVEAVEVRVARHPRR